MSVKSVGVRVSFGFPQRILPSVEKLLALTLVVIDSEGHGAFADEIGRSVK